MDSTEFLTKLHRQDFRAWQKIMCEPLPTAPVPNAMTLYQQDVKRWKEGGYLTDPLLAEYLTLPLALAHKVATRSPLYWTYLLDFTQEGNAELLAVIQRAYQNRATFYAYSTTCITGMIYKYIPRMYAIYIPSSTRYEKRSTGEDFALFDQIDSLEALLADDFDIEAPTTEESQESTEKRAQAEQLLAQLPGKERRILMLRYGIGGPAYDNHAIAAILQMSHDHVQRLATRALKRLRGEVVCEAQETIHQRRQAERTRMQAIVEAWEQEEKLGTARELMQASGCTWGTARGFMHMYRAQKGQCEEGESYGRYPTSTANG